MRRKCMVFVVVLTSLLLITSHSVALTVTPMTTGDGLAANILGSGISIVGSAVYTGSTAASGYFSGGNASGIGIESGIIMTSGYASIAPGPNSAPGAGKNVGQPGDSQLDALVAGSVTFDAAVLEFDFTTSGGNLYFNYVFASEEYNEWVNHEYNDVFAFYLDGVNIALIPGTSTPVSINTVNGGNPIGTDPHNPQYFNNNDMSLGIPTPYDIQYDGFTDVFTAQALGIGAGIHHIKLAIADTTDHSLDSAVFIQAGTFSDTPSSVPEPATFLLFGSSIVSIFLLGRKPMN